MKTTKLYTHQQMLYAFEAGMRKQQHILDSPGFMEWVVNTAPVVLNNDFFEEAKRQTAVERMRGLIPLTPQAIIEASALACEPFSWAMDVLPTDLTEPSQTGTRCLDGLAHPRMVAYYLCFIHTDLSYLRIGKLFGNRLHTTVMSGVKNIVAWKDNDSEISLLLNEAYVILERQGFSFAIHPKKVNAYKKLTS